MLSVDDRIDRGLQFPIILRNHRTAEGFSYQIRAGVRAQNGEAENAYGKSAGRLGRIAGIALSLPGSAIHASANLHDRFDDDRGEGLFHNRLRLDIS